MAMPVDLRSDTVTKPSEAMRRAMAEAEVGDDVYGEDPTVNRLQERAAEITGKEAGLLVPSGTMGNLIGLLVNAPRGTEVIADAGSHLFLYETAGAAVVGSVQVQPLASEAGILDAEQVRDAVRPRDDAHQPFTAAVCLENPHNRHGGVVWPLAALREVEAVARGSGLRVHLDGARIFNAAVALGVTAAQIAAGADTVTFCLSKGLGCPVGSVLCGPADGIAEALRMRKMLGGGMRQAGVLAAAGLLALDTMVDRLADDHRHARTLAEGLSELGSLEIDLARVQTNFVLAEPLRMSAAEAVDRLRSRGVLAGTMGPRRLRFVTHDGITAADVQNVLAVAREVLPA